MDEGGFSHCSHCLQPVTELQNVLKKEGIGFAGCLSVGPIVRGRRMICGKFRIICVLMKCNFPFVLILFFLYLPAPVNPHLRKYFFIFFTFFST